ncbi:MAG: 50S ribosomal protein L32 [Patescibacteria group bacterium]|nr:50S ribosomal protein L32 [Patescibacteria group bacterium]
MANPKKRKARSAVRTNRAHLALEKTSLDKCPKCGKAKKPHTVCVFCGTYRGRQVLKVEAKAAKSKK